MVSPLRVLHYAALRHHRLYGRPDVHGARVIFESVSQSHTGTEDCCFTDSCTEAGLGRTYQQSIYSHVDCRSPVYRSVRSTRSSSNSSGGKSIDRRRPLTVITFTLTFFCCLSAKGYATSVSVLYRQDAAKRQTAGIKFTHRPKIRLFAPHERLVAPTGTWVRLAVQNFTSIATGGGNAAPKMSKISTFW